MLKFQKFQKNYFANNQNEDINYLIINETQIKEVDGKVKLSNLIDYIFNPNTEDIYDSKNKVDFIIKKFSSQFKALTNENIILKNIIKDYEEKINNIKNLIINTINSLFQFEDKWKSYENIFSLKNNFNNLIKSIRKAYNNKYELKKLLDDSQKYGIKCQKFILYYAFKLIYNKIMENKDETFKELDKLRDNIINNYTKIEIMKIIDNFITQLKFNSLDINNEYNEFLKESEHDYELFKSKIKIDNQKEKIVYYPKLKEIIGFLTNLVRNIEINLNDQDKRELIFECFKYQIGYPFKYY